MFIDYYNSAYRRQILSDYIDKHKGMFDKDVLYYELAGPRNGGFSSHIEGGCPTQKYLGITYIQPVWKYCFYAKEIGEHIYVAFDAFDVYRSLVEQDVLYFQGEYFDFFEKFHSYLCGLLLSRNGVPRGFKRMITKKERKNRKISRKKAINILIEYAKNKIKYKI